LPPPAQAQAGSSRRTWIVTTRATTPGVSTGAIVSLACDLYAIN
jgi:hypothetical protein